MAPEDLPLVFESWIGTYRTSPWAGVIPNNKFTTIQTEVIVGLLQRGAKVLLLCNPDRPSQILAWVCYENRDGDKPCIHYLFTKAPFRRRGCASSLLGVVGADRGSFLYTHRTSMAKYWPRAKFYPEIARRKER